MEKNTQIIKTIINRPGMFFVEYNLFYAVRFISGVNFTLDSKPLDKFHDWIVDRYFDEPQSFAWEVLIRKIPECSAGDEEHNVKAFLDILDEYVSSIENEVV